MKKSTLLFSLCFFIFSPVLYADDATTTLKFFDEILFYDGYAAVVDEPVPDGIIRHKNSLYATKISPEQLASFGNTTKMHVTIKASCDNYDRIGNVNLAFVPKGEESYLPEDVERIELGRFITPFMDKNKQPDEVPYEFEIDYIKNIFRDKQILSVYDLWIELEVFGVPYAANTQIAGCAGRNDVFFGTLEFETSIPPIEEEEEDNVMIPLFFQQSFNNYNEDATDILGETVKSITFSLPDKTDYTKLVLITSNHGANSGGEEYNRRWHYVYFDEEEVLQYKPGRTSCEPFRIYNTQANGIYGLRPKTDAEWQSFSNWCPGDVIDTRIIDLGIITSGEHTFKIEVPDAVFRNKEGYIPLSLYLLAKLDNISGSLQNESAKSDYLTIYPDISGNIFSIKSNYGIKQTTVYNINGYILFNNASESVDLSNYNAGIYIIRVKLDNDYIYNYKVLKK